MTSIIILSNSNIESFYDNVMEMLDARYHQPGNSFPTYQLSDQEIGEIESLSSYASHASDNVYIDGKHIERLIS